MAYTAGWVRPGQTDRLLPKQRPLLGGVQSGPARYGYPNPKPSGPVVQTGPTSRVGQPHGTSFARQPGTPGTPLAPTAQQTAPSNSATTQTTQTPIQPVQSVPLDATALNNIATHLFDVNNQIGGLTTQQGYASTDLQKALAALQYQQPRDELSAEQAANRGGGLYSTVYAQNLANLGHQYGERTNAANDSYQRTTDALAAKIAALQGGIPLFNEGEAAASAARAAAQPAPLDTGTTLPGGTPPGRPMPPLSKPVFIPGQSAKALVKALSTRNARQPFGAPPSKQELKSKISMPSTRGLSFSRAPIITKAR